MPRNTDAFLAELGLEHADPTKCELGDGPASQILRAGLNHEVLPVGSRAGAVARKVVALSVSRVSPFVPV